MKIFRGKPASGKPPKIICAGCGKPAIEAGIAVPDEAVEQGFGYGPDGPIERMMIVDDDDMQPLCESCVTTLQRETEPRQPIEVKQ